MVKRPRLPLFTGQLLGLEDYRDRLEAEQTEFQIHVRLAHHLDENLTPGWEYGHYPSGELRDKATAGKLKAMGVKSGWPDFLLFSPEFSRQHGLELKRRGKKPTSEQVQAGARIIARGGLWAWADSFDDAVAILRNWGAIPPT